MLLLSFAPAMLVVFPGTLETPRADCHTVVLPAPQGTGDVMAASSSVSGSVALALRNEATGKFGIWLLDLRNEKFHRLAVEEFQTPVGVGLSAERVALVLHVIAGGVEAAELRDGTVSQRWIIEGSLPRTAIAVAPNDDGDEFRWLVGGVFRRGGAVYGGLYLGKDGAQEPCFPLPDAPDWIGVPGTNFTRLSEHPLGYVLTNSVLASTVLFNSAGSKVLTQWPMADYLPAYVSASDAGGPPRGGPPAKFADWLNSWDCADESVRLGDGVAILVRLDARAGHALVLVSGEGAYQATVVLPRWVGSPMSADGDRLLVVAEGAAGRPATMVLTCPSAFLNPKLAPFPRSPEFSAETATELQRAGRVGEKPENLVILNPRRCRGQMIRVVAEHIRALMGEAQAILAQLPDANAPPVSAEEARSIHEALRRHIRLSPQVLLWDKPLPPGARPLPGGLGFFVAHSEIRE